MNQNNHDELKKRHISEKTFHDLKYSQTKQKSFYALGFKSIIFDNMLHKIGDIRNKKVLEFGCGNGWQTKILASKGAEVWAFDISDVAVKKTSKLMEDMNLQDRVHVDQMPAEKLAYESDMFDVLVGNAILHHLDLNVAMREIHRVLKRGGKAYFLEPLGHNPFINLFRRFTPDIRTKDETPLRLKHFDVISKIFAKFKHEEYYFLTLLSFFWYFLIRKDDLFIKSRNFLFSLDTALLKKFPSLKKYCWYTILMVEK